MSDIPLSKMTAVIEAMDRRDDAIEKIEHYSKLVSVGGYFENDGTDAAPLPEAIVPEIRRLLVESAKAELAEADAALSALGIDPKS